MQLLTRRRWRLYTAVAAITLCLLFVFVTRFNFKGHYEGLFLLKGREGRLLELKDDLFLGDGSRLITGVDFEGIRSWLIRLGRPAHKSGDAYIEYEWYDDGDGLVQSYFPDGTRMMTCMGRFLDEDGGDVKGLFLGGGIPEDVSVDDKLKLSETGMAYFDGKQWRHIWCSSNEGLASATTYSHTPPSSWEFLGSRVLNQSDKALAIQSSHKAVVDGVPLRVDRFAYFRAGRTFLVLSIRVTNTGKAPVSFYYVYGDEPWLGEYGTSKGNVGWVKDRLVKTVQWVDSAKFDHAGFFDYGNDLAGEGHDYTYCADFIQWLGDTKPAVYFSNGPSEYPNPGNKGEPLKSDTRFIGLQWGPDHLAPGKSVTYSLAVGMAMLDPKNGMPVKPEYNPRHVPQ